MFQPRKELADTVKTAEQIEEKNYEAAYNDDNTFAGHGIVVYGTDGAELTEANIEG